MDAKFKSDGLALELKAWWLNNNSKKNFNSGFWEQCQYAPFKPMKTVHISF